MSDIESEAVHSMHPNLGFEQLKLLFDYTKFHIGLYTSIATLWGGVIAFETVHASLQINYWALFLSLMFLCLTGLAGGVVTSSITQCDTLENFLKKSIGPFRQKSLLGWMWRTGEEWTYIEHFAFWISVGFAFLSVAIPKAVVLFR